MLEAKFASLVGDIYEAALSPAGWRQVMDGVGQYFGSHTGAVIVTGQVGFDQVSIFSSADRTSSIQDYQERWSSSKFPARRCHAAKLKSASRSLDILHAATALQQGEVRADYELMSRHDLEHSVFFNEHLRCFDFVHAFSAKILNDDDTYYILSLSRARKPGEFTPSELSRYSALQTHIQRALAMAERVAWASVGGIGGEADFVTMKCPAILVDQAGACAAPNTAAEALLAEVDGIRIVRGRLRTVDPAVDAAIAAVIEAAIHGRGGPRRGGSVLLPRGGGRPGLVALVTPIGTYNEWFLARRPAALLTLADLEARTAPAPAMLKSLYGLTPSEVAVAQGIAGGLVLSDVASDVGLTVNTARQYLTRVFAKTQTTRQHDLVRLLAQLSCLS